jgi:C4-dicarboxylate transporter DctM subunit
MSPVAIGVLGLVVLFALLAIGMPIGFAMALVGFVGFALITGWQGALTQLGAVPFSTVHSYILTVLPLFLLMGQFAFVSGLTEGAYYGMHKWLGRLPGGLAMATIGGCAAFAAVCGSSMATASTMSSVAYPEMNRYKYDPKLALGSIAAGGTLGILIPPSIPFIIYAIFAEESVGRLFMAGVFPGIILSTLFILTIYIRTKRMPSLGPPGPRTTWLDRLSAVKDIWPVALLAFLVLGGIWGGVFTPVEAGGAGAFCAFVIGLARRQLTIKNIASSIRDTVRLTAMIFTILIGAMIFNYFIVMTQLPAELAMFIQNVEWPPIGVLVGILFIYIILGCLMDTMAMTVLTLPIFIPLITNLGFDLVWFGVVFVVICEMALITPPIGMNVFVISGMAKDVPMYSIFRGIIWFVVAMAVCEALVIIFPQIALFLPNTMIG